MAIAQKNAVQESLGRLFAAEQVITDPEELLTYEIDASLDRGQPDAVVFPRTVRDVEKLVAWAAERGIPLIPRGSGTGLSGGAVPEQGGIIVEFSRLNQVLDLDEAGRSIVFQPGIINLVLDETTKAKGLYYPADPASGRACTLGGNIGENAGGPHCFKYGVTTNYITGLEMVLANGRRVHLGGRALDYPEYDLVGVVTGSEGTLGIITEVDARLMRNPPGVKTALAAFNSVEEAGQAVSAVISAGLVPATMEMMDQKIAQIIEDYVHPGLPVDAGAVLIIEVDGYPESLDPQMDEVKAILRENRATEVRLARTAEERDKIWYGRKSAFGAISRVAAGYYIVDGTVPRSKLAEALAAVNGICETHRVTVVYVFHAGDGNLHPLILIPDWNDQATVKRVLEAGHEVMALCVDMGGSITGEHGVGISKRDFMPLMYNAGELGAMRDVKDVFDPRDLMNPGKIFPSEAARPKPAPAAAPPVVSPDTSFAPASAEEAVEAIRSWSAAGKHIHIRGAGTASRRLPETDVVLSTAGLCGVRTYSLDDLYVTAGAGTSLSELQAALARDRMWVPLVSPWPESTLGGIVATNFNAPLRMLYGGLRDLILAMTAVLPDGRIVRIGRPVVKNVAGYDLTKLFIGSYGTLGLIADVSMKIVPQPRARESLFVPAENLESGLAWGKKLLRTCLVASSLLLCRGADPAASAPYVLVYTAEGTPEDVAAELAQVRTVLAAEGAADSTQASSPSGNEVWATWLRATGPDDILVRVGVPAKDLPGIAARLAPTMGDGSFIADLASGLLFARGVADVEALRKPAREVGGYAIVLNRPAASNGALDVWGHAPDSLELMRALRGRWDVQGVFNPGAFVV